MVEEENMMVGSSGEDGRGGKHDGWIQLRGW